MQHDSRSLYSLALLSKSFISTSPLSDVLTGTTCNPAICAEAGFVPCADMGIKQMSLLLSPRDLWYRPIVSSPAYSPWAPELDCIDIESYPVTSHNILDKFSIIIL